VLPTLGKDKIIVWCSVKQLINTMR